MRKALYLIVFVMLAVSCSEDFEIRKEASDIKYFVVDAILTDVPSVQTVTLSESIPYVGKETVGYVSGATVIINDGNTDVLFTENPEHPGLYCSPDGYCGIAGTTYNLRIQRNDPGAEGKTYEASATMREFGFDIKAIDYKYTDSLIDSVWTMGVWGTDSPAQDQYLILPGVNGASYPIESTFPLEDYYFSGCTVAGYPVAVLNQSTEAAKTIGAYRKPLETGDVVSLTMYDMPVDFYDYMMALMESATAISIPIISSQPANLPSNIKGENVVGFFGVAPMRIETCVVQDPYKKDFDVDESIFLQ